jgi:hypothetical protein
MINPAELRIGNFVEITPQNNNEPKIRKVYQIRYNYEVSINIDGTFYAPKQVNPVKLNKECLEIFGLNFNNGAYDLSPFSLLENGEGFWLVDGNYFINRTSLKTLHHLQNLFFALTEKELIGNEIKMGIV